MATLEELQTRLTRLDDIGKIENLQRIFGYYQEYGEWQKIVDWEIYQSYRRWVQRYGPEGWEKKLRHRYEYEMQERNDTHFFVGTIRAHPKSWIIIGLFYPPGQGAVQSAFDL